MQTPFDKAFMVQQQQIMQLHLKLEIQMKNFLAFIQQSKNNGSPHISPPPKPTPPPAARYLHAKIYQYFLPFTAHQWYLVATGSTEFVAHTHSTYVCMPPS